MSDDVLYNAQYLHDRAAEIRTKIQSASASGLPQKTRQFFVEVLEELARNYDERARQAESRARKDQNQIQNQPTSGMNHRKGQK